MPQINTLQLPIQNNTPMTADTTMSPESNPISDDQPMTTDTISSPKPNPINDNLVDNSLTSREAVCFDLVDLNSNSENTLPNCELLSDDYIHPDLRDVQFHYDISNHSTITANSSGVQNNTANNSKVEINQSDLICFEELSDHHKDFVTETTAVGGKGEYWVTMYIKRAQ